MGLNDSRRHIVQVQIVVVIVVVVANDDDDDDEAAVDGTTATAAGQACQCDVSSSLLMLFAAARPSRARPLTSFGIDR